MNREGIVRRQKAGPTDSPYRFADSEESFREALAAIDFCVVKPVMSPQEIHAEGPEIPRRLALRPRGLPGFGASVIVEAIDFDYEITLLTVRHRDGTLFCDPIGHVQVDDYWESWQPQPMAPAALEKARARAAAVTEALGASGCSAWNSLSRGESWFSEVSPGLTTRA